MEQEKELGCGIGVIFVPAKFFIRSPVSIPTPGRRWMSFVPGGRNSGIGPTWCLLRPHVRRAHWHSLWVGKRDRNVRAATSSFT